MSQTSIIAGALIVAFIVFVTVRGELPGYLSVIGFGSGTGAGITAGGVNVTLGGAGSQPAGCPPGGSGGLGTTCGGAPSGIPGDSGTYTPVPAPPTGGPVAGMGA